MDESLFSLKKFKCSRNESFTIHCDIFRDGIINPVASKDYNSHELMLRNGLDVLEINMLDSFKLVIHAIVDNEVYISLIEKTSEKVSKTIDRFILSKRFPRHGSSLIHSNATEGAYIIYIKEYGKIKRGVMYETQCLRIKP